MTSVVWTHQALRDLDAIRAYIAEDSTRYADLVVKRIFAAVERLREFPESGRMVPERETADIREVIVRPYRVVYRLQSGTVQLVPVFRSSRRLPDVV